MSFCDLSKQMGAAYWRAMTAFMQLATVGWNQLKAHAPVVVQINGSISCLPGQQRRSLQRTPTACTAARLRRTPAVCRVAGLLTVASLLN